MTNSWEDTLSVIDTQTLAVVATWNVGAEPSGVVAGSRRESGFLLPTASQMTWQCWMRRPGVEQKRLLAGRGASYLTLSPDGSRIYCTHVYPNPSPHRTAPESEITVIDANRARGGRSHSVALRSRASFTWRSLPMGGWAWWPNTIPRIWCRWRIWSTAVPLLIRSRFSARMWASRSRFRWMSWNTMHRSRSAWRLRRTSRGSMSRLAARRCVTAIDVQRLLHFVHARPRPEDGSYAQDLSASANYVVARIPVGHNPRGVSFSRDGRRLFVANRLEDTISVIDTRTESRGSHNSAGRAASHKRVVRRGEQTFYTARLLVPGADRLLQLPHRFDIRWTDMGPGAGWFRPRHRRQPAD